MYAVIESGGKQHRVELGSELAVDRLEAQPGETISFDQVLLVADDETAAIGRPHVPGATVSASVVRRERGEKIVVFKYRPKARHRAKNGARAELTILRITDIVHGDLSAAKQAEAARTERERVESAAAEAAARQAEADKALARKLASASAEAAPAAPKAGRGGAKEKAAEGAAAKAAATKGAAKAAGKASDTAKAGAKDVAKTAGQAKGAVKAEAKTAAKTPKARSEAKPERSAGGRTQAPEPPKGGRSRTKKDQ